MIKLSFRKNLIYLVLLTVSVILRRILSILIDEIYSLNYSLLFMFIMFLGEIIGGFLVYRNQISFLKKNEKDKNNLAYTFIKAKKQMKRVDSYFKIALLIYFASFFDLIEFLLNTITLPKIANLSNTSILRLFSLYTITSFVLYYTTMKFKVYKHQIFSLIILGISLSIIITIEFIYKPEYIYLWRYIIYYLLVFCHFIFLSLIDIIERYLYDFNFLNPLSMIMIEGIFGFITTTFYSIYLNPFTEITNVYNNTNIWKFISLIFLLILYFVLCAAFNIYRILSTVLYSPITRSLSEYLLNCIFIVYYYLKGNDFIFEGESNFFYFFINFILSIFIDILALIYNEIIILNFCGLADGTHEGITNRANIEEPEDIPEQIEQDDYIYNVNENEDKDSL